MSFLTVLLHLLVTIVVVIKGSHQHNAAGILVAKQSQTLVGGFFQIAEADDVAAVLHGIQYAVGAAESLQESMHLQVLIHPQRVQRLGIETRQEHVDHNQQVQFAVLHALAHVLVEALESF